MNRIIGLLRLLTSDKTLKLKTSLLFVVFLFVALPAWAGINEWTTNGPKGGLFSFVIISPNYANDSTVFAVAAFDGLYKSTDGGQSWTRSGLTDMYVNSIAISPNYANDSTVFAGPGDDAGGDGVYKSTDGGQSWSQNGLTNMDIYSVAISPNYANDSTVFAATSDGVASYTIPWVTCNFVPDGTTLIRGGDS